MASFKKIRLDPDAPPNHRNVSNQPGANDTGGRSFLDGSSFSSSTSGGSGAYRRSSGPFRTRFSQPMGTPSPSSNSFSRFAPYYFGRERRTSLRVPLIRARRDDSDSEGYRPSSRASLNSSLGGDSTTSATSSTAQRIIETLQNLSTPVMNAGKIRIDQDISKYFLIIYVISCILQDVCQLSSRSHTYLS